MLLLTLVGCALGCGDDGDSSPRDAAPEDTQEVADAMVDSSTVPATITITGTVAERSVSGTTPLENVTIGAYRSSDEATAVATATSAADGTFTLTIETGGVELTGFVKGELAGYATSYLYPAEPVATDTTMVPLSMVTTENYDGFYAFTQETQTAGTGLIIVLVTDGASPVEDATVSTSPAATYKYSNPTSGLPDMTSSSTAADGLGYVLNAPAGAITVSATKTGATFKSNSVKAFADALTTTQIIPQ